MAEEFSTERAPKLTPRRRGLLYLLVREANCAPGDMVEAEYESEDGIKSVSGLFHIEALKIKREVEITYIIVGKVRFAFGRLRSMRLLTPAPLPMNAGVSIPYVPERTYLN